MKVVLVIIFVILIAAGAYIYLQKDPAPVVTTFEECAEAGYPILESYPEQCRTPEGQSFTRNIGNELEKHDLIQITYPRPSQVIPHTIQVTGQARGTWFFEADFPVYVENEQGEVVVMGIAQAQDEWMTESFVPFAAELEIPPSVTGNATLILQKDNPSGLPEHDDELRVPIVVE